MKRFALLCRISTPRQRLGESLDIQEERGRAYVKRHSGRVVKTYRGVESGTKPAEERTLFQHMIRDAKSRAFDALWVLDKSRLSRSAGTVETIAATFGMLGTELHTSQGRVDLGSAETEFITILEAAADRLSARRSTERTRQTREKKLAAGEHAFGRWPWGRKWDKKTKTWSIDPEARRQAQRMHKLYVERGFSTTKLAAELGWPLSTLTKRLHSAGRSRWVRKLTTPEGEKTFTLDIPGLLTPRQAAEIERRARANLTVLPQDRRRSLLQGLIRCENCGGSLSHVVASSGHGAYRHNLATRREGCIYQVPSELIERAIVASCGELISSTKSLKAAIQSAIEDARTGMKGTKAELGEVERQIRRGELAHDRALKELIEFNGQDRIRNKLREAIRSLDTRLESLRGQREGLAAKLGTSNDSEQIRRQLAVLFGWHGRGLVKLSRENQRELVSLVVGRTRRDSEQGIFVNQAKIAKGRRDLVWNWRLHGNLGLMAGAASRHLEHREQGRVRFRLRGDPSSPQQLARVLGEPYPLSASRACT